MTLVYTHRRRLGLDRRVARGRGPVPGVACSCVRWWRSTSFSCSPRRCASRSWTLVASWSGQPRASCFYRPAVSCRADSASVGVRFALLLALVPRRFGCGSPRGSASVGGSWIARVLVRGVDCRAVFGRPRGLPWFSDGLGRSRPAAPVRPRSAWRWGLESGVPIVRLVACCAQFLGLFVARDAVVRCVFETFSLLDPSLVTHRRRVSCASLIWEFPASVPCRAGRVVRASGRFPRAGRGALAARPGSAIRSPVAPRRGDSSPVGSRCTVPVRPRSRQSRVRDPFGFQSRSGIPSSGSGSLSGSRFVSRVLMSSSISAG